MTTKLIIDNFTTSIDMNTNYSIADLVKMLKESYKTVKSTDKNGNQKQKKAPSTYNLFIKDTMAELKGSATVLNPKDLMREATKLWKLQKEAAITKDLINTKEPKLEEEEEDKESSTDDGK